MKDLTDGVSTEKQTSNLKDIVGTVVQALRVVKKASELPQFVLSKGRDLNADQVKRAIDPVLAVSDLAALLKDRRIHEKISNDLEVETKEDFIKLIKDCQLAIETVASPRYKLMLQRYISASELAVATATYLKGFLEQNNIVLNFSEPAVETSAKS